MRNGALGKSWRQWRGLAQDAADAKYKMGRFAKRIQNSGLNRGWNQWIVLYEQVAAYFSPSHFYLSCPAYHARLLAYFSPSYLYFLTSFFLLTPRPLYFLLLHLRRPSASRCCACAPLHAASARPASCAASTAGWRVRSTQRSTAGRCARGLAGSSIERSSAAGPIGRRVLCGRLRCCAVCANCSGGG